MNANLMSLAAIIKSCMVEEVPLTVIIAQYRVVTACHVCAVKGRELVVAHHLKTHRIEVGVCIKHSLSACGINERSQRRL